MRFNEEGLYRLLEKLLRAAKEPKDCNELFDNPEVRQYAASANRVSDYLGNMWRKGLLKRLPATDPGRGPRWKYIWKDKIPPALANAAVDYVPKSIIERDNILISETGDGIQIDLERIVILIKVRK